MNKTTQYSSKQEFRIRRSNITVRSHNKILTTTAISICAVATVAQTYHKERKRPATQIADSFKEENSYTYQYKVELFGYLIS